MIILSWQSIIVKGCVLPHLMAWIEQFVEFWHANSSKRVHMELERVGGFNNEVNGGGLKTGGRIKS